MSVIVTGGIFLLLTVLEHPIAAALLVCLALWGLCGFAGDLTPLTAAGFYAAVLAAGYFLGDAFIRTSYIRMGGIAALSILLGLSPVIYGGIWYLLHRLRRGKRDLGETKKQTCNEMEDDSI
ncbi:hypothetical protein [Cloacibacillus sp.]|uniref:hypothetical protein n=1 Tax=Cloacibacillus sp. TaxID=2049023 RepID=UPI0025C1F427|nr:hypothetical protein [Cloacibacillus sp.]MCC8056511.1 hypothetical protein [Cloacibacillus sp.]